MPPRRLGEDRGAILRMAGNIAAGLITRGIASEDAAGMAVDAAVSIIRDVDRRIAAEPAEPYVYVKPPRTGYSDSAGVYHPSPGSDDYRRHCEACPTCRKESK